VSLVVSMVYRSLHKYGPYIIDTYWTIHRQNKSWSVKSQTGQLADYPVVNSPTAHYFLITKRH